MDEASLVAAAQRGRVDAFNELVLAYQQQVYNLALRMLGDRASAADVTQDAFFSAYRSIGRFRGGSFRSYVLRIVGNACLDELRRRKRRPTISIESLSEIEGEANPAFVDESESLEERAERLDRESLIQEGIDALPVDQRAVLTLRDVLELSYEEIAEVTGTPLGTVRSRLARGRKKLAEFLDAKGELFSTAYRLESRGTST
jgi:RNA polymerase sigma-70 factor (ECF subfamily)